MLGGMTGLMSDEEAVRPEAKRRNRGLSARSACQAACCDQGSFPSITRPFHPASGASAPLGL